MKNKAFTLIELLAVIILLGILMLIAIPSVTSYINNSRKNVYVDTAKELVKGTSILLNSGDFSVLDKDTTYYVNSKCIASETGKEVTSPFGKFNPAYVLVVNEDDEYNYYFQSRDEQEIGVKDITTMESLEISKIVSNVKEDDIDTTIGIGNTTKTAIIDENCNLGQAHVASRRVSKYGESNITLTYDNQGGDGCESQSQHYGEEWGKLCKPTRNGYQFVGWYKNPGGEGKKLSEHDEAQVSITVYAKWTDQFGILNTGETINRKMKTLSGDTSVTAYSSNNSIKYIKYSEEEPGEENKQSINIVSKTQSKLPIYMWFDNDTIWWWCENPTINLNPDSKLLFSYLSSLVEIDNLDYFNTSDVTTMFRMFNSCGSLLRLDLSSWDTSNVTSLEAIFRSCGGLTYLNVSTWDTSKNTSLTETFDGCYVLPELNVNNFDTSNVISMYNTFGYCYLITSLDLSSWNTPKLTQMSYIFGSCKNLTSIDFSGFDTSNVTSMYSVFSNCQSLTSLDLSNWDVSSLQSMQFMFSQCYNLEFIDLSTWVTPKLNNMGSTFRYCYKLESVDMSKLVTSKVTTFTELFMECHKLKKADLSNFDTSNATTLSYMFWNCYELTEVDVSGFNTSKVTYMYSTFYNCYKLETLDISGWDTSKVTNMSGIFWGLSSVKTIYASDLFVVNPDCNYSSMFLSCGNLVGGQGTKYDSTMSSNAIYARIDDPDNGKPGLFTSKV